MMPLPGRPLSSVAFQVGGETTLFDAGEGTQVAWRASNFSYRSISTILLSHVHADHIGGLPGMLFQMAYSAREDPVTIYGPEHTAEVVTTLMRIVGRLPFELRVVHLEGGEVIELPGQVKLATIALSHRIPCVGYQVILSRQPRFNPDKARALNVPVEFWKRLQQGETIGGFEPEAVTDGPRRGVRLSLITDTRYTEDLAAFASYSDLLICESMYVDDMDTDRAAERGHMTLRQATKIARAANVGELWLTHFSPKVQCPADHEERARSLFPNTRIGYPGLCTNIAFPEDGDSEARDAAE